MSAESNIDICCRAIAEGIVMLEHDGMLPLNSDDRVAVFGRAQFEYIKSGSGSGGLVVCPYVTNIGDELKKRVKLDPNAEKFYRDWIVSHPYDNGDNWQIPQSQAEAHILNSFVRSLAEFNDKAIIVISRICGECFDLLPQKGGYYLTDEEENTIKTVAENFKHTCVLLNVGNIIDMRWVKKYSVGTVMYVWQGGQDGGVGVVKALLGETVPSGRLPDTIAVDLSDYPAAANFGNPVKNIHAEDIYIGYRYFQTFAKDKVLYPFGYGLSYTEFEYTDVHTDRISNKLTISVAVKNTGCFPGKDVVQCYVQKPIGKLGNPVRELVAFRKTSLLSIGECETVILEVDINNLTSYDDSGKSGFPFSYVLEQGCYKIYIGKNVVDAEEVFSFDIAETQCVKKCVRAVAPIEQFDRIVARDGYSLSYETVPVTVRDVDSLVEQNMPQEVEITGNRGITLQDVEKGKYTLDAFIAQLNIDNLCCLVRGEGMSSPKAPIDGTAGSFGGLTEDLNGYGIPIVTTVDGPCGVRLSKSDGYATCIPTGTLIASTWSRDIAYELFDIFAKELRAYNLDIALAPGINIHRHVLGGRNFEYFSEDPLLTGLYAETIAKCFCDNGVRCTLKHFAVNSQELERSGENEVLSERALREIYLKGFEIAVKSGYVQYIMSSYNRINGVSAAANYDLLTEILRNEWGFKGVVMTDWWAKMDDLVNNTYDGHNLAAMMRAQNDVYMVTSDAASYSDDLISSIKLGTLGVAQLQRSAKNILTAAMESLSFKIFDKSRALYGNVSDKPIAVYSGSSCRVDIKKEGIYSVKIVYSCNNDTLIQNEVRVFFEGNERQTILLPGTCGSKDTYSFLLYLHPNATIEFRGPADISSIEIREITSRG